MAAKVLMIDDDPTLGQLYNMAFTHAGFQTQTAQSGVEGLNKLYDYKPDLVLLDVMMPDMDGWQVCSRIREVSAVPIIMITAVGQQENLVKGLDLGADDYLVKPVVWDQLHARVRALLRRSVDTWSNHHSSQSITLSNRIIIDLLKREVTVAGERVKLSPIEFQLLTTMARHKGKVLPHDFLLKTVWGSANERTTGHLHVYIGQLRQKLEKDPARPNLILNEWGIGYRLD